jgi:hypothetical protein
MMRLMLAMSSLMTVVWLSGCGEKPQTLGGGKNRVAAYQGADNKFVAPGWTPGDKTSWEQELKARAQNTQNEYSKMTVPTK